MPRRVNEVRLERLKKAVETYPGERPAFFAHLLGWRREEVARSLAQFDQCGVLFCEDDRGRIWPFKPDTALENS